VESVEEAQQPVVALPVAQPKRILSLMFYIV